MLTSLENVLNYAEEKEIAIGSFNTPNLESLRAVITAAEELKVPVIVQMAQCHEPLIPLSIIGPIMVDEARRAAVPVCVHLDHGETVEYIEEALKMGFTSCMFDGSTLPFEDNIRITKQVVALAKSYGANVEAELGSMGEREFGEGTSVDDDTKIYTDPALAGEFVKRTGIDAIACSFGTTHGLYLTKPKLNFDIVRQVRRNTENLPVVMHGGSGVSSEGYRDSIRAGVRKINYFTYMDKAGGAAANEYLKDLKPEEPAFYSSIRLAAEKAMKENVLEAMKVFAMKEEK